MNARCPDAGMSTCRPRMNPSWACAARALACSFTRVHTGVAAHARVINQSLQTMALSTAFRAWLSENGHGTAEPEPEPEAAGPAEPAGSAAGSS
ncbi:hypothetical protein G6F24_018795 [Rhizopus arrhizus]|nr:hypothetical protein G6F24_018795 [Rhizopus arrhizus]